MLHIENISVSYQEGKKVIKKLDAILKDGETVGLIGTNGAGKSTLLLSLVGILLPSEGRITIDGIELNRKHLKEIRERIGLVFQNPDDQLFMASVYDDIAFGLRNMGKSEEEIRHRISRVLGQLGVEHLEQMSSGRLSGGEKKIIAIATVLVMEPSVILFDEPTSFLDPRTRRRLIRLLRGLQVTKLIATHDLDMALELCDRVIILKEGEIFAQGSARDILTKKELLEEAGLELPFCLQGAECLGTKHSGSE